jgi:hypothetical protein
MIFVQGFLSSIGTASELILDRSVLDQVSKQARENPYRLKCVIGSKEIFYFEVGKPVTPYFRDEYNGIIKRRFHADNRCFEVSFFEKLNFVKKTSCHTLMNDVKLPGFPEFHAAKVSELLHQSMNSFEFWNTSATYNLNAFVHTRETIQSDQQILNLKDFSSFPIQSFTVKTESLGKVSLDPKAGILIEQHYLLNLGQIGIQNEQKIKTDNSIKRSLDQWVFTNGQGKVILLNDLMIPYALQNFIMTIQPKFIHYVKELEKRSAQGAICYRDSWIGPADQDCHYVLTRKIRPVEFSAFQLLMINFQAGTVVRVQ